jgi:hypothetical protein
MSGAKSIVFNSGIEYGDLRVGGVSEYSNGWLPLELHVISKPNQNKMKPLKWLSKNKADFNKKYFCNRKKVSIFATALRN